MGILSNQSTSAIKDVLEYWICRTYLYGVLLIDDLAQWLQEAQGIEVSLSTIWHALKHAGVGRKTVLYVNCLQRLNWWPEHAITNVLKSAMNLTCRNWGFHYDTRGRIKSWNFRSASNVVVHILKNPVNSYDSNGVIAVPISTLGDEKQNLLFFCLPIFPRNSLNVLGHIIRRWKDIFKENTTLFESWETVQNWRRNSGNQFYEFEP